MSRTVAIALVLLIALGGVGLYLQREHPQPTAMLLPTPGVSSPSSRGLPITAEPQAIQRDEALAGGGNSASRIAVPGMVDGSDEMTRAAAYRLAPALAKWLTPEQQLRKWVALVDAVAEAKLSEKILPLKYPMSSFSTTQGLSSARNGEAIYASPTNFARTNLLIETLTAIPPQTLADYYHAWSKLLERANAELGRRGSFDSRLHIALQKVIAVEPLPDNAALARPQFYYTYADPALEKSSDVAKLLWRMGPANQHQLQSYLSELLPLL